MTRRAPAGATSHRAKTPPRAETASPRARAASPSAPEPPAPTGRYRIQTIARMTGLQTPVLRAWERRYGLIVPARDASGYREYTDEDLRVLQRAKQMLDSGLSIGEVARIGRAALAAADSAGALLPATREAAAGHDSLRDLAAGFVRAVIRGEVATAEELVSRGFHSSPLGETLRGFVTPSLVAIGEAWERGEIPPGVERLATHLLRAPLEQLLASANLGLGPVLVVSTPAPGDEHELGALIIALETARAGHRSVHLGGRLAVADIARVVQIVGAKLLCLSFVRETDAKALSGVLEHFREELPGRVRLLVGGRGIAGLEADARRAGAEVPATLEALLAIAAPLRA